MIAGRLLSILLRLQQGPVSAGKLAEQCEVSQRTIYRDVDQLSHAGIPVYCERGLTGGVHLDKAWSNRSFGLSRSEIEALLAAKDPDLLCDLGLNLPLSDAQRKLVLALPAGQKEAESDRTGRILIDPVPWYRRRDHPKFLKLVATAVWDRRQLAFRYGSWTEQVERVVDPLGLVLKGAVWYLVAGCEGSIRTYRIGQIAGALLTGHQSCQKDGFDLAEHWKLSVERFEDGLKVGTADVLLSPEGLRRLDRMGSHVVSAAHATRGCPDKDRWITATIPIESIEHATIEIIALGRHCRVLSPPELKSALKLELQAMLKPQ